MSVKLYVCHRHLYASALFSWCGVPRISAQPSRQFVNVAVSRIFVNSVCKIIVITIPISRYLGVRHLTGAVIHAYLDQFGYPLFWVGAESEPMIVYLALKKERP